MRRGETASLGQGGNRKVGLLDRLPGDIFGSDVFVGYQGTYVWQANQLGHIAIGLVFASVFSWGFRACQGSDFDF